ncbi:MAG TPA: farnesyl diphosphate synthase [Longimicrobiaceae bacterium]|nr:farnesyl diphosphate synthase [Longimicrobiaceae bacterium]
MTGLARSEAARTSFHLDSFLDREGERVERALEEVAERVLREIPEPLASPMRYALETRGKRLRPILCVAAYRAVRGGDGAVEEPVYRLACALEIVHTYSLVHDDLPSMDDDDVRRGRPTVHRVYGSPLATLAGAALLPAAAATLDLDGAALGLPPGERGRLVSALCAAVGAEGMVGGQLQDLEGEGVELDAPALERIHQGKTGALLAASLRLGGIAAGGSKEHLRGLSGYGEALGLAFQIVDDVLDVTAHSHALGKTAGKDVSSRKNTYPALFGVEGARRLARERAREARRALAGAGIRSSELEELADFVVERER